MITTPLTEEILIAVGKLMAALAPIQSDPPAPLYVSGVLDVRHSDGWKVGELRTDEDWWIWVATMDES